MHKVIDIDHHDDHASDVVDKSPSNCEEDETSNESMEIDSGFESNADANNDLQQFDLLNEDTVRRLNEAYLLGTKEEHKLTQKTVDTVVSNTTTIVQNSIELLRNKLWSRLDSAGVDFRAVPGLHEFFEELCTEDSVINNPFLGMETKSQQNAAFKELFDLVVSYFI